MIYDLPRGFVIPSNGQAPTINVQAVPAGAALYEYTAEQKATFTGRVVYNRRFFTRVGRGKFHAHDGRLQCQVLSESTEGPAHPFGVRRVSGAAIREVVKGLMLADPRLINARSEATVYETLFQLAPSALAKWAHKNRKELQAYLGVPLGLITQATSQIRSHDGDVEAMHRAAWRRWRTRRPVNAPQQTAAAVARNRRGTWIRRAMQAMDCVEEANAIKADSASMLSDAPDLSVYDVTAAPPVPLQEPEIQAVNGREP